MIKDALNDLPPNLEAEVCIVGGGPAGIVLALELARRGRRVVLIEGGGVDAPGDAQSVYNGEVSGRPYPLMGSRLRWLGGTSNHWGGWVKPLDDLDFRDKPHFPMPGWPLGPSELKEWYRRAADWCEVDEANYNLADLGTRALQDLFELGPETGFTNSMFRFSPPTRFGSRYRDDLESAENVECLVHLNAVGLIQSEDRIRAVLATTLSGDQCEVRAGHFVLAMGGIENARFLLNQEAVPGNHSDLVGRCFMDHYGFTPGKLLGPADQAYERGALSGKDLMFVISPDERLVMDEGFRNSCLLFRADSPDKLLPPEYWESALFGGEQAAGLHTVAMINEPLPHPDSRITLSEKTDALGLRRARLHWHLPESEFDSAFRIFERFTREISKAGIGRIRQLKTAAPEIGAHVGIGYHHMGTTRMSSAPEYGVTDEFGKCWDRENLYIAGSSLFPNVGHANPTLTIVALAARLASHLSDRLEMQT